MKIKLSNIVENSFDIREEFDEEHFESVKESLEKDGQWNPVIVRPSDEGYELISGHYRFRAAKELGWKEIEAKVKDVEDLEAEVLSIKTNVVRKEMAPIEMGNVLNDILQKHDISQKELSNLTGIPQGTIQEYIMLALDLHEDIIAAIKDDKVSRRVARVIGSLEKEKQPQFFEFVERRDITDDREAVRELKNRYKNDTIFTMGYQGRDWSDFIEILQKNDIDMLVDVRKSAKSQYKPEFNGDVMKDRLENEGIRYIHKPELGVEYAIQQPYKERWIGDKCFEDWYNWWVKEGSDFNLLQFVNELEEIGKPAIMCMERYPSPQDDQEIYCHRHFLAEIIRNIIEKKDGNFVLPEEDEEKDGRSIFPYRKNL